MEAKYEREYSASIDPFTAWRSKERERGRAAMALHDRMLYAAGQMVATNPCAPRVPRRCMLASDSGGNAVSCYRHLI